MLTDGTPVLGFRLSTVSVITATDDQINELTGHLRTALNSVPAGLHLQLLRRSRAVDASLFRDYVGALKSTHPLLREQRAHSAAHLQRQGMRCFDTFLLISRPRALVGRGEKADLFTRARSLLGFGPKPTEISRRRHLDVFEKHRQEASQIVQSLGATGITAKPLTDQDFVALAFAMLNPGREDQVPQLTDAHPPKELPPKQRPLYRALSLREQLVQTSASHSMDALFLGEPLTPHRVLTLKAMPRTTEAAGARVLNRIPFDHWLSVGLSVPDSEARYEEADKRRKRAHAWAQGAVANIKAEEQAAELTEALRTMTSNDQRVFNLSVAVLLSARDVVELEHRSTDVARVFGGIQTPVVPARMAQLTTYVSMLPGCSHLAPHSRTVLTDNAAHFLPVYDAWQGDERPTWLASTRNNEPFRVDLRNPRDDAWNVNVFGRTGSGKSFFVLSQLEAAMLGQNSSVIIIDVGGAEDGSYYRLCKLLGGDFVDLSLDGTNAINPFPSRRDLYVTDKGAPASDPNPGLVNFLLALASLACHDQGDDKRSRVGERILRDAIVQTYERLGPDCTPIFSDVEATLASHYKGEDSADEEQARRYAKTLRAFLAGPAGKLMNQPSRVKLGSNFVVFDLKGLENLGDEATAMLYVVNSYVWTMLGKRNRDELAFVVYDETWKIMKHPTGAALQEELYRTARKLRAGVVSVTQKLEDFLSSSAAKAVLSNTLRTFLLRHKDGHDQVGQLLGLNDVEAGLFRTLDTRKGYYSEVLMRTDAGTAILRYSASPWDYWLNTTDGLDKKVERDLLPQFGGDRLATLRHLVATYPNGAAAGAVSPPKKVPHAA
ncbi:hypothetical protein D7Y04_41875 [Corallococcus sp. AB038B]|nr:hypothetical protein D7Y04_41875 [Corallococcus sp. AB038B]